MYAGQTVSVTTTGQRTNQGLLRKGWQPRGQAALQLWTQQQDIQLGPDSALLLKLAEDACGALTVQWQASPDHFSVLSPWEVCNASPLHLSLRVQVVP